MQQLQQLKSFDASNHNVEEMVCLLALAMGMIAVYEASGEVPEWLGDQRAALTKAIEAAQRDELERQLKEITARQEALKTADEKRGELREKEARIRAKLNKTPGPAA